jgi:hypothetical protein
MLFKLSDDCEMQSSVRRNGCVPPRPMKLYLNLGNCGLRTSKEKILPVYCGLWCIIAEPLFDQVGSQDLVRR